RIHNVFLTIGGITVIKKTLHFIILVIVFIVLSACSSQERSQEDRNNLVNKVNTLSDHWINYKGVSENKKSMVQSQFIPYDPNNKYEVSLDTYVSYFNGENFIKTELYVDTPDIID